MVIPEEANKKNVNKPLELQLFREDLVESITNSSLVGLVSKVGGYDSSSDSSSSSEPDSEGEEDAEDKRQEVAEGCARVCWINAQESTERISDIRVLDRVFLHGDVVASAVDPLGQTGTIFNVEILVDLQYPNGDVIKGVNSKQLQRIRSLMPGDFVIHKQWLGRVDVVLDHVTVLFNDGAKCKVMAADPDTLVPVRDKTAPPDSAYPYYPGLRVRSTSFSLFKNAKWLRGKWKASRVEGVVAHVEVGSVLVYWVAAGNAIGNSQTSIPAEEQNPRDLVPLTHFSYANWQFGDRCIPPKGLWAASELSSFDKAGGSSDLVLKDGLEKVLVDSGACAQGANSGEFIQDSWAGFKRKIRRCSVKCEKRKIKKKGSVESVALIANTRTTVDLTWQDGTKSLGIPACSLIPVDHLGDHDFWPEQFVLERCSDEEVTDRQNGRTGIIRSVDSKQRIARVAWLKPVLQPEEAREFETEDMVSVYELLEHPDYNYCLADVVIRLSQVPGFIRHTIRKAFDSSERVSSTVEYKTVAEDSSGNEVELCQEVIAAGSEDKASCTTSSEPQDLSWVGVVTRIEDGEIEVAWANGLVSKVGPQAIFVVSRDDDETSAVAFDLEELVGDDGDDAASWETVDSTGMDELEQSDQLDQPSSKQKSPCGTTSQFRDKGNHETQQVGGTFEGKNIEFVSEVKEDFSGKPPGRFGGSFTFPRVAITSMVRFAGSLLGFRGMKKVLDVNGTHSSMNLQATRWSNQVGTNGGSLIAEEDKRKAEAYTSALKVSDDSDSSQVPNNIDDPITTRDHEDKDVFTPSSDATSLSEITTPSNCGLDIDNISEDEGNDDETSGENIENQKPLYGSFRHFDIVKDSEDHHYFSETGQAISQRKWVKKIQQEWTILEKSLPDTIFVRVYEERMDLLRAVIIGAAGTPYHDGLFVFDMHLPPEYPNVPPMTFYHSRGLRLNPNLYENGKVCLSLLNTWAGKGLEVWNPGTSSILQLLVSIQGLVLNAKPYFNEAGYDKQVGTPEGEKNSVVYNENSFLMSCQCMLYLLRRPPQHFEELVRNHFKACGSHILSACRAYLSGVPVGSFADSSASSVNAGDSSDGFKLMLAKLVPRLVAAFSDVGAIFEDC